MVFYQYDNLEVAEAQIIQAGQLASRAMDILSTDGHYRPKKTEHAFAQSELSIPDSLLGRLATVSLVIFDIERSDLVGNYFDAQKGLEQGSNGYFRVSNSIVLSRHQKIVGQDLASAHWRKHAAGQLTWTATHDLTNILSASKTFVNHRRHTLSIDSARESITTHP